MHHFAEWLGKVGSLGALRNKWFAVGGLEIYCMDSRRRNLVGGFDE